MLHMDAMTIKTKMLDAEMRGSNWLAEGNEAAEHGNKAKAEKCYDKAQFWLDRYNNLREKLYASHNQ